MLVKIYTLTTIKPGRGFPLPGKFYMKNYKVILFQEAIIMILKNTRYYKWDDNDNLIELKIVKQKNDTDFTIEYTQGSNIGTKETINKTEILEQYTKLAPDGTITFAVVGLGGDKPIYDVMVFLNRTSDAQQGIQIPYCVCRQCVNDLFAAQSRQFGGTEMFGLSISQDSCPSNVPFYNFTACNTVSYSECVSYYIGDKLSDILKLIKTKNFDDVLYSLFSDRCKVVTNNIKYIYNEKMKMDTMNGYCKTLKYLLELNNFEYDILTGYNILPLGIVDIVGENDTLAPLAQSYIGNLIRKNITSSLVIKYDKSIDLKKIERNYQLVADNNGDIYVVAYTYDGNYNVPIEQVESEESIEKLNSFLSNPSVKEAYNHIHFNRNKYE